MNGEPWQAWAQQLATGIALVGPDLHVRWLNPALAELLACGTRSALGQPLALWLTAADDQAQVRRAQTVAHAVQLRGVSLLAFDDSRQVADVTAQVLADGNLLLEIHPLAASPAATSPLSATLRGFAHEVKNPLAGLRGAAQLLVRRAPDAAAKDLAQLIIDEADRLAALANRLLHHGGNPQLAAVNLHELLDRVTELVRAEPAAPQLRHDFDPSLPSVHGDADRLQQIVLNLVRNAVEAHAQTITLRTRAEHGARLAGGMLRAALRLDVIDDGSGVPAALHDTLFEPLVSGRADGTGLGLALAREFAREHGGDLTCNTVSGRTVFSLYLPLEHGT
ncbi:MAG: PAS domain-containing sensor histidine kinase [Rhodanobacter sp.]|nr:MAG: PAS domain-containing sensor histidine kinase [Rhodanobacter sp.]TAM34898.1 MAG: PAS domain-containing sensor histidine kinase [Rhodanobacter sp.]